MPSDLSVAIIGAFAIITASIIGFIVASTTARISKEQKVSEFRQSWIDLLRNDIAVAYNLSKECIFLLECYDSYIKQEKQFRIDGEKVLELEMKNLARDSLTAFNTSHSSLELKVTLIKLRLNPDKDSEYITSINLLMSLITWLSTSSENNNILDSQQAHDAIDDFEIKSHLILKSEWDRVKNGEKSFVLFITVGEFLGGTLLVAFYILLALVKFPEYFPDIEKVTTFTKSISGIS